MNEKISKTEMQAIVEKLSRWLANHDATHYLHIVLLREHELYQCQLEVLEGLGEEEISNQVPTEHYKNIEWVENTARPRYC